MDKKVVKSRIEGSLLSPSSKSYAQRAVAAALLAHGESTLTNMELCDDISAALSVAEALGAKVIRENDTTYKIIGGLNPLSTSLDIGESGLATRLFTPIAALYNKYITINGHGSILLRPITMMEAPLRNLGVNVSSTQGFLPLSVCGPLNGGETEVDGSVSSQFITGLLMALPLAENDSILRVGVLNSIPYIDMTIEVAKSFGVSIRHNNYKEFFIDSQQSYTPTAYNIEGDWSGASCMLVAGAIAGCVTMRNLNPLSKQADIAIIEALSRAGAEISSTPDSITIKHRTLYGFEFDATHCPDLFPALAALAANCEGISTIIGTNRLTHKESNRAKTIADEFGKMGIYVDISQPNIMQITPSTILNATIDSHNDHRIAMAAAVTALNSQSEVVINRAEAVDKSYPAFWDELEKIQVKQ